MAELPDRDIRIALRERRVDVALVLAPEALVRILLEYA